MPRNMILALLPLALVLAACGNGEGADTTTTVSEETTTTTAAPSTTTTMAEAPTETSVSIANFSFDPGQITVEAGTKVTWTNDDSVPHTVTADDGSFESGTLQPGASYSHTFESAATVAFHCDIHPSMTGTVEVTGGS